MSKAKIRSQQELNMPFWLVMCFTALYMMVAPFFKGLFNGYTSAFEGPIYGAVIAGVLIFGVMIYDLMRSWEIKSHRDILAIMVWLIPLTFWISSFGAASGHFAANEVVMKYLWAIFFMIGAFFTDADRKSSIFQTIFMISGYLLVLFGFLNWFGNVHFEDAVLSGRLSNVFQYPNAYAAVLIGLIFSNLIYANRISNQYKKLAVNAMLVPLVLSFVLTLSRGALLVLPFILLIYFLFLHWRDQLSSTIYLVIAGVVSLLIFSPLTALQESGGLQSLMGWGLLLMASVVASGLIFLFDKFKPSFMKNQNTDNWTWTNLIIPLAVVVVVFAVLLLFAKSETVYRVLPEEISARFEGLSSETTSVYDRNAFYKDALSISMDYPLFGAGGGAWPTLYNAYKSYPYTSAQAHNFYFQHLVEVGWFGVVAFLVITLYSVAVFVRTWFRLPSQLLKDGRLMYPIFALAILIHSFLDFDMSFLYIATLVMMMLGATVAVATEPQKTVVRMLNSLKRQKAVRISITTLFVVTGLIIFIGAMTSMEAHRAYTTSQQIARTTASYPQLKLKLDEALNLKPHHPEYNLFKIGVMFQLYKQTNDPSYLQEAADSIDSLVTKEPFNRALLDYSLDRYLEEGRYSEAKLGYFRLIDSNPWDIQSYERAVEFFVDFGLESNDFSDVFITKQRLDERIQQLKLLPPQLQHKYRNFKINHKLALHFARAYFAQGNFDLAAEILTPHLNTNLDYEYNLMILRIYIASLHAIGSDDEPWKKRLYEYDPMEEQLVEQLVEWTKNGEES